MMNYDSWKLSNPIDDGHYYGLVSSCCGSEYIDEDEDGVLWCDECKCECDSIEDYEYEAQQRENYLEMMADGMRDER